MPTYFKGLALVLAGLVLSGCLRTSGEVDRGDSGVADAAADGMTPDAMPTDAALDAAPDAELDMEIPDAFVDPMPDAEIPDVEIPDAACVPSIELCNGEDDDCDEQVDEGFGAVGEPCDVGEGLCARTGRIACNELGEAACDAVPGMPAGELCNAEDDDCDGRVDEAFPTLGQPCGAGVGACRQAGLIACDDAGQAVCSAQPGEPSVELCNGVDDDCDGTPDEAAEDVGGPCVTGRPGRCAPGALQCVEGERSCEGLSPLDAETCDGLDEDCDGATDEEVPGLGEDCGTGESGICAAGQVRCLEGGLTCQPTAQPGDERCDGQDNDCDGATDETFPGLGGACGNGVGACRRGGTLRCAPDALSSFCAGPAPGQPVAERCGDGVDQDCDGRADEGFPQLGEVCSAGIGVCQQSGIRFCDRGVEACSAQAGPPVAEVCNALDDDCDGQIDEAAIAEVCDLIDNDCDGRIDEGFPELGEPCSVGVGVCARVGAGICGPGGGVICTAQAGSPAAEVCNDLDDDCDGAADEDFPTGAFCQLSQGRCAAVGTFLCDEEGALFCDALRIDPLPEQCNGVDDDCDGATDEQLPDADVDGLCDLRDNCPGVANPDQRDLDEDGLGDVCDPDRDEDGIADEVDRCPEVPDPLQADLDDDGFGDACDLDDDGDGVSEDVVSYAIGSPNPVAGGRFGHSVAISGDRVLVGARFEPTIPGLFPGRAYTYTLGADGQWGLEAELVPEAQVGVDIGSFGAAVSLDGDVAAVGAFEDSVGGVERIGAVYVFRRVGPGQWVQEARLVPEVAFLEGWFGGSVSIQGDRLLIGATREDVAPVFQAGAAYIFERENGEWSQVARLTARNPIRLSLFGESVALLGDEAVVGAPGGVSNNTVPLGDAHVFRRDPAGQWRWVQALAPPGVAQGDQFGARISLTDRSLAVGAPGNDLLHNDAGALLLYELNREGLWSLEDATVLDLYPGPLFFGIPSARDGVAVCGAPGGGEDARGTVVRFEELNSGAWRPLEVLPSRDELEYEALGSVVATSARWIVAGAPGVGIQGLLPGLVIIYPVQDDNCPRVANPDQADADGDGVGDACEP